MNVDMSLAEIRKDFNSHIDIIVEALGKDLIRLYLEAETSPRDAINRALSFGYFVGRGYDLAYLSTLSKEGKLL